jgi:hypothetical protein
MSGFPHHPGSAPPRPVRARWRSRADRGSSVVAALLLLGGCASAPPIVGHPTETPMMVDLDDLRFLRLSSPRAVALKAMRAHGFDCHDEAATEQHLACTSRSTSAGAVVLSFVGETLDAVRTAVPRTGGEARDQFDAIFERGRRTYAKAFVQRTDTVSICRFLPGDGTSIEVRHFEGADTIEQVHFAPLHHPPDEPRRLKVSQR